MSTVDWKDVTIVLANGEKRLAKACYAGDGWCDVIVESDGLTARMWVLADGSANPPMNPCRLAEPFPLTPLPARTLPVTPAERTAVAMLRAWHAWQPDVTDPDPICHMLKMFGVNAANAGLVYAETDDLTPAGRDLLARVDAAPMPPAPPRSTPRPPARVYPRPVPRRECARCDQYYSYGTGVIAPCKDSTYRHGKDGPGWRDPLHEWHEIDAPPRMEL